MERSKSRGDLFTGRPVQRTCRHRHVNANRMLLSLKGAEHQRLEFSLSQVMQSCGGASEGSSGSEGVGRCWFVADGVGALTVFTEPVAETGSIRLAVVA